MSRLRVLIPCLLAVCCALPARAAGVVLPDGAPSLLKRIDPGRRVPGPRVRIGLSVADSGVAVGVTGGSFRILSGDTGEEVWPERADGEVLVVPEGGALRVDEVFRVQVGSFRGERAARELASELERRYRVPCSAAWQPSRGVFRVRVGREPSREALAELADRLRRDGYTDAWITSEPAERHPRGTLRVLDSRWDIAPTGSASLVFVPDAGASLTVEGRAYRGLVEVLITDDGELVVVNELNLEAYLRGVVPEELGPAAFPELEALKAQAVAARTYVMANLGQFASDGYDICDTPRCQVYGGASAEHPLSDRAVRETRGRILVYGREPINAMYTSTCGGHTEDVEVVFPEMRGRYLRGVRCAAPQSELERRIISIDGRKAPARERVGGGTVDLLTLSRLVAHGVLPDAALEESWLRSALVAGEFRDWAGRIAPMAGRALPDSRPGVPRRLELWLWIWDFMGLSEPGSSAAGAGDELLLLSADDVREIPAAHRLRVATLIALEIVRPSASGRLAPMELPRREEAVAWLARLAERYEAATARTGTVRSRASEARLVLRETRLERAYLVDASAPPLLLSSEGGSWHRLDSLDLLPGDRVHFVADPAGRLLLVAAEPRRGVTDDRSSRRYRWTRVRSREQLERSLGSVAPVGRLTRLSVLERGRSGRVAAMRVVGERSEAIVEGFRLRRALGLPEILFDLEQQVDESGALSRVVFTGRGWGHGVGLCQFGAFGMAQRGASFEEILRHYYSGVRIVRAR